MNKKRTCLGKIVAAHGVKGFVKIKPFGEDPFLMEELGSAFTSEDGDETLDIFLKSSTGKYILAEVEGCTDRNRAEELRGTELFYDRDLLPETDTEEGEFYHDDLIGLKAVDEKGAEVGKIIAVENFGAGDLLEIKPANGEAFYVPFNDDYVPDVNLESGIVTIKDSAQFNMSS